MAIDPKDSAVFRLAIPPFLVQVERAYSGLISGAVPRSSSDAEPGLGGELFYAGELDSQGRAFVMGANIAGAASLIATADEKAQKQAVRDGVADFLVNSLDEALRILKNEIRKRETVAVCVAQAPETVKSEMLERGVLPDLIRPADEFAEHSPFVSQGAGQVCLSPMGKESSQIAWSVTAAPAQWLPKIDATAMECLPEACSKARRWLRHSPRYLGRLAKGTRLLVCDREFASDFVEKVRDRVDRREIDVELEIQITGHGICAQFCFSPRVDSQSAG